MRAERERIIGPLQVVLGADEVARVLEQVRLESEASIAAVLRRARPAGAWQAQGGQPAAPRRTWDQRDLP